MNPLPQGPNRTGVDLKVKLALNLSINYMMDYDLSINIK